MKWFLLFLILPWGGFSQSLQGNLDCLKFVSEVPYACDGIGEATIADSIRYDIGCGDKFFWQAVKGKQNAISGLIDMLTDTTATSATVPYFGGQYAVADVAYAALQEIIKDIPTFELMGIEFDASGCGYCSYWNYVRADISHREKFKASVQKWYRQNKAAMIWVKSDQVLTADPCAFVHPNHGHYEVRH